MRSLVLLRSLNINYYWGVGKWRLELVLKGEKPVQSQVHRDERENPKCKSAIVSLLVTSPYCNFPVMLNVTNIIHVCLFAAWFPHHYHFQKVSSMRIVNLSFSFSQLYPQQPYFGFQQETDGTSKGRRKKFNKGSFYQDGSNACNSGKSLQPLVLRGEEEKWDNL